MIFQKNSGNAVEFHGKKYGVSDFLNFYAPYKKNKQMKIIIVKTDIKNITMGCNGTEFF